MADEQIGPVQVDVEVDPAALERIRLAIAKAAHDGLLDILSPAAVDLAEQAYAAWVGAMAEPDPVAWGSLDDDARMVWRTVAGTVARQVALRSAR